MTRTEAHAILDAARDGADISCRAIHRALQATGDIDPEQDTAQVLRPVGTWRLDHGFLRRSERLGALLHRVERVSALEAA